MARKGQVSIQTTLETNEEFEAFIESNKDLLICLEVYSEFCGYCLATGNAVRKAKLDIGGDNIAMARAAADHIDALVRFRGRSEPIFLFITKGKLTRAIFGANGIELCQAVEEELELNKKEIETGEQRPKIEITQLLPEEAEKLEEVKKIEEENYAVRRRLKELTLAARKKRVNERLQPFLCGYNFILFWPHCHQAHYDLYEKWDAININVSAKEEVQIKEEDIKEIFYMSDIEPNEACVYALCKGEALVVLFKTIDSSRDFVQLLRHALYEEVPEPKEDTPPEKQLPPIPAYERYASLSKTAREVRRDRYNQKLEEIRKEKEEKERLEREIARIAREAAEEEARQEQERKEKERMARLAQGLPADPEPEPEPELEPVPEPEVVPEQPDTDAKEGKGEELPGDGGDSKAGEMPADGIPGEIPGEGRPADGMPGEIHGEGGVPLEAQLGEEAVVVEEPKAAEEEVFNSDVEVEGEEYIPPGGLFVPGLYSPPNILAKNNGIVFFFPKVVSRITEIESEHLPPHVLVMFSVDKRQEIMETVKQLGPSEVLAKGFFVGDDVNSAEHIAYTLKQYEKMNRRMKHKDRIALMVSRKRSFPLLQLTGFNPCYISGDLESGERDCLQLFPVGYGDEYVEEESVVEEEVVAVEPPPEPEPEPVIEEPKVGEEEEPEED